MKNKRLAGLGSLFLKIQTTGLSGKMLSFEEGIERILTLISARRKRGNKIIIIGNGGSASIASHIVTDLIKNLKIPALAFNDPSLLTCLSNDLGYDNVFSAPIEVMAEKGDILFAISSSGRSKNILKAVLEARRRGCFIIGLSGFSSGNPLRRKGDINFYVPSFSYGAVEIAHLAICHAVVDILYTK